MSFMNKIDITYKKLAQFEEHGDSDVIGNVDEKIIKEMGTDSSTSKNYRLNKTDSAIFKLWMLCFKTII